MTASAHKNEGINRTKKVRFYPFVFTGKERDEETGYGYTSALGGSYENHYKYDALHRLATVDGTGGPGIFQDYLITAAGRLATGYQLLGESETFKHYAYSDHQHPHAPRRIYVKSAQPELHDLRWDAAGNLGQLSTRDEHSGEVRSRFHLWTEDSRLHTVVDDRHHSYYAYDHTGERTLKVTGHSHQLDVNADLMHTVTSLRQFTVYPSPYLVLTEHGYTKHYYAGAERLAARQGGGFGRTILGESTELSEAATRLFDQSLHQAPQLATPPEPHLLQEGHLDEVYDNLMKELFDLPEELVIHAEIEMEEFLHAMQNLAAADPEPDVYFYHSDHLGSASWITDGAGIPIQHLQYLPYGEPFVNQRAAGYSERFTFTGKERDEETGYGYFGARYMDHELMTMWLSVDPMADKYPSISPYAYCAWNPVKLVDPDGREIWLPSGKEYKANMDATGLDESDAAVVNALNEICKSDEGLLMINKLCSPGNEINVNLTHGETKNTVTGPKESFYDEGTGIPGTGLNINVDIEWNLNNPEAIPTVEGMQVNATYNLLDEICHAYDYCTGYGTNAVFNKNCDKGEMQAVYRSNVVRHQLGDNNYRTRYYVMGNSGSGPITAKRGEFYRPCWYPKAKTDNTSISMQY